MITSTRLLWSTYVSRLNQQYFDIPSDIADEDPTWIYVRVEEPANTFHAGTGDFAYTIDKINKRIKFTKPENIKASTKVWIRPNPPLTQAANFINGSKLDMEVLENAFDKLTMICQLLDWEIGNKFGLDHTGNSSPFEKLAHSANRNDKLLGFTTTGAVGLFPKVVRTPWAETNLLALTSVQKLAELLGISEYLRTNLLGLTSLDGVRQFLGATPYGFSTLAKLADLPALKTHLGISTFAGTNLLGVASLSALKTLLDLKHSSTDIHTTTSAYSKAQTDAKIQEALTALFPADSYIRTALSKLTTKLSFGDTAGILTRGDITVMISERLDPYVKFSRNSYIKSFTNLLTLESWQTRLGIQTEAQIDAKVATAKDSRFPSTSWLANNVGTQTTEDAVRAALKVESKAQVIERIEEASVDFIFSWKKTGNFGTRHLYSVHYLNNEYWIAGNNGVLYRSPDGHTWTSVTIPGNRPLREIAYGGGRYVVVGGNGAIYYSTDGATWTAAVSNTTRYLITVIYAAGKFIVGGDAGTLLTSTDGITWTARTGASQYVIGLAYGQNRIIASGNNGMIIESTDGITWTARTSGTTRTLRQPRFFNSLWVVVGNSGTIVTSPDGINWTVRASGTTVNLFDVTYEAGWIIVGDNGVILRSSDGMTWTLHNSGQTAGLRRIIHRDGRYLAVGLGGTGLIGSGNIPKTSWVANNLIDPATLGDVQNELSVYSRAQVDSRTKHQPDIWVSRRTGITNALHSIAFGDGKYVAVGSDGAAVVSTDRVTWSVTTPTTFNLIGVAFVDDQFIAAGHNGTIITSPDGVTWTARASGTTQILNSVAYGRGLIVVVGAAGEIRTSTDGITWTARASGTTRTLFDVVFLGGQFIAVGASGTILTSPDGITWTARSTGIVQYIHYVAYDGTTYVAVCGGGRILTSTDGITWTIRTSGQTAGFLSAAHDGKKFIAVGSNGISLTSIDGVAWTSEPISGATGRLNDVQIHDQYRIIVGENGQLYTSFIPWEIPETSWVGRNILKPTTAAEVRTALDVIDEEDVKRLVTVDAYSRKTVDSKVNNYIFEFTRASISGWNDGQTSGGEGVYWKRKNLFVIANRDRIFTSPDGHDWTLRKSGIASNKTIQKVVDAGNHVLAIGSAGVILRSSDGTTWEEVDSGTSNTLYGYAVLGRRIVLSGLAGTIVSSEDQGATWSVMTSGTTNNLNLRALNGNLVAFGANGIVLTSEAGLTWTLRSVGTANSLYCAAYGGGMYVIVGSGGDILTSSDLLTWTVRASGTTDDIYRIAYGGGRFVAVANNGQLLWSTDGIAWNLVQLIGANGRNVDTAGWNVIYDYGFFWLSYGHEIIRTRDGVTYDIIPEAEDFSSRRSISDGKGTIVNISHLDVAVSSGNIPHASWVAERLMLKNSLSEVKAELQLDKEIEITNGDWAFRVKPLDHGTEKILHMEMSKKGATVMRTHYDGEHVNVFADGSFIAGKGFHHLLGAFWEDVSISTTYGFYGALIHNNTWFVVGFHGLIYDSTDRGKTWNVESTPSTSWLTGIFDVGQNAFNQSVYRAFGQGPDIFERSNITANTWDNYFVGNTAPTKPLGVEFFNDALHIDADNRQIYVGTAGSIWEVRNASLRAVGTIQGAGVTSNILNGIAMGNSTTEIVIVGDAGTIVIPTTPGAGGTVAWITTTAPTSNNINGVIWDGTQFVAVGGGGTILLGSNKSTWVRVRSGGPNINAVTHVSGQYLMACDGGKVLIGIDPRNMIEVQTTTTEDFHSIWADGDEALVCGSRGKIFKAKKVIY